MYRSNLYTPCMTRSAHLTAGKVFLAPGLVRRTRRAGSASHHTSLPAFKPLAQTFICCVWGRLLARCAKLVFKASRSQRKLVEHTDAFCALVAARGTLHKGE